MDVNGNSTTWENKIDVDTPLGAELFGHELRTGGFFSRTDLYGGLQDGLKTDYMYEAHGRIVLDFLVSCGKCNGSASEFHIFGVVVLAVGPTAPTLPFGSKSV